MTNKGIKSCLASLLMGNTSNITKLILNTIYFANHVAHNKKIAEINIGIGPFLKKRSQVYM